MRAPVDFVHAHGQQITLYLPAPWVETRPSTPEWWVVQRGFVRDHRNWLIPLSQDREGGSYVYDLSKPGMRGYLTDLLRKYLVEWDADGLELDMVGILGNTGGPFRGEGEEGLSAVRRVLGTGQTMEVYRAISEDVDRLKPGAWIDSGWATPPLAQSLVHSFRVADEKGQFSSDYPFLGLVEQIAFNTTRAQLLGRRPNVGFVQGNADADPATLQVQRQWLAAAVALQAQVTLSVDVTNLRSSTRDLYREYLAALQPFSGSTRYGLGLPPESWATQVGDLTYIGLLNPAANATRIPIPEDGDRGPFAALFDPQSHQRLDAEPSAEVAPGSFRLLVGRSTPGVLWADRAWEVGGDTRINVSPGPVAGRLWLYAPEDVEVLLDGEKAETAGVSVLQVDLPNGDRHLVEIRPVEEGDVVEE
jgi:hypothetical protein